MSTEMQTKVQASPAQNFTPAQTGLLQRKYALCNTPGLVEDSEQDEEERTLQRSSTYQASTTTVPSIVHKALRSSGQPLDAAARTYMEPRFGHDFSKVRVHTDAKAAESARVVNALAYTVGRHIVFSAGYYAPKTNEGQRLLAHELAHTVQQQNATRDEGIQFVENTYIEGLTNRIAEAIILGEVPTITPEVYGQGLMRSVSQKILIRSAKWLTKRTVKTVSKHIAKHARRVGGKAIHSVFKSPKKIKLMLEKTVKEALELATKHRKTEALEEGGLKIIRQSTRTPGKFRWVVQKIFDKAIGTKGEKILRIIIDQSGRIVTAFPADRLIAIGLGVASIEMVGEKTAEASTTIRQMAEAEAARREKEEGLEWEDFIPLIGDIWGGSLNVGEQEELRQMRFIQQIIDDIIKEVEFNESRSLAPNEREEIEELVRAAIAAPLLAEEGLSED